MTVMPIEMPANGRGKKNYNDVTALFCLVSRCNTTVLTMRPYMLPGLLRAVFSGNPEGGPAGGLLKAEALSFGGVLSEAAACKGACTHSSGCRVLRCCISVGDAVSHGILTSSF